MISRAIFLALLSGSQTLYTYESYYQALPGHIFDEQKVVPSPAINHGTFSWQGRRFRITNAHVFPSELANEDDFGPQPVAYKAGDLGCIEGQPSSSSGTAVRHFAVYLIDMRRRQIPKLYKLPSMFGSCQGVRMDSNGNVLFDDVVYRYRQGGDTSSGIVFVEQRIRRDQFERTGRTQSASFVEEENVWKFALE